MMVFALCMPVLRVLPGIMGAMLILGAIAGATFYIPLNLALAVSDNAATIAIAGHLGAPFALILSIIFLGDRIGLPRLSGIVMEFAGVLLLAFDPAAVDHLPGLALTALRTDLWAIASLLHTKPAGVPLPLPYSLYGFLGA